MSTPTKRRSDAPSHPTKVRFEAVFGKRLRQYYSDAVNEPASAELAAILKRLQAEELSKDEEVEQGKQKGGGRC